MDLKKGDLVAFATAPDATWFEVLARDKFNLTIREYDGRGTPFAAQVMDESYVKQVLREKD
jgi:hypothetical protein